MDPSAPYWSKIPFNYFGSAYNEILISSNGYICLDSSNQCGLATRPNLNVIVGLNYDLDTTRLGSGQIFYSYLRSDSFYFRMARQYVNLINIIFVPTFTIMITYDRVLPHLANSTSLTSFQIFLSISSIQSYVIFNYTSCPTDLNLLAPSGLDHTFAGNLIHMASITNWCNSSNVEQPGVWVFDVTKGE